MCTALLFVCPSILRQKMQEKTGGNLPPVVTTILYTSGRAMLAPTHKGEGGFSASKKTEEEKPLPSVCQKTANFRFLYQSNNSCTTGQERLA